MSNAVWKKKHTHDQQLLQIDVFFSSCCVYFLINHFWEYAHIKKSQFSLGLWKNGPIPMTEDNAKNMSDALIFCVSTLLSPYTSSYMNDGNEQLQQQQLTEKFTWQNRISRGSVWRICRLSWLRSLILGFFFLDKSGEKYLLDSLRICQHTLMSHDMKKIGIPTVFLPSDRSPQPPLLMIKTAAAFIEDSLYSL